MKLTNFVLPAVALGAAALLLVPQETQGFTTIGGSLNHANRSVRVFNNFLDAIANDNQVTHPNFPGYQGAAMAIWKATIEWGSELHGDGSGDPHQNFGLGSGGANFDPMWMGLANGIGGTNDNISSALHGNGGGTLAFVETPISDGWRMRFYENWNWADGPSTAIGSGNIDIQGVATHEYGHSLGLGHTNVSGATMTGAINGNGVSDRSIAADDIAGVQFIYGVKSATKPRITGIVFNPNNTITINGTNFSATGNQVWFTQAATGGTKSPIMLTNVSSSNNGTVITVTPPGAAGPGDVIVRNNGTGHANLSNAWPANIGGGGPPPPQPIISSVTPNFVPAVNVDGQTVVTLTGAGFTGMTDLVVDGIVLSAFPPAYTVSENQITFPMPHVTKLGPVLVEVVHPNGNAAAGMFVLANQPPVIEVSNSVPGFAFTVNPLQISIGAQPGDLVFLLASPQNTPSVFPGIVSAAIGNNFTTLFQLGDYFIDLETGRADVQLQLPSGLPLGINIYFQAARFSATTLALPLETTNVQQVTVLF